VLKIDGDRDRRSADTAGERIALAGHGSALGLRQGSPLPFRQLLDLVDELLRAATNVTPICVCDLRCPPAPRSRSRSSGKSSHEGGFPMSETNGSTRIYRVGGSKGGVGKR
jgi:hypothetical protein